MCYRGKEQRKLESREKRWKKRESDTTKKNIIGESGKRVGWKEKGKRDRERGNKKSKRNCKKETKTELFRHES